MGDSGRSAGGRKTRVFGDYELLTQVGKGGMGSVFKARRISTGEIVAFKALPPSFAKKENLVARFKREVRILLGLKHPNIIQGFDSGQIGNLHYLAMEYVDGRPVSEELARKKRLPGARVVEIMTAVARALAYAHSEGLIHRDHGPARQRSARGLHGGPSGGCGRGGGGFSDHWRPHRRALWLRVDRSGSGRCRGWGRLPGCISRLQAALPVGDSPR